MLEVRFFGTFAIQHDGKPVVFSSRAAQSLFAYLILTAGTRHRREKLAGLFWPDAAEEKARAYLRHQLWRIRKSLSTRTQDDPLVADAFSISFSPSVDYWLDVKVLTGLGENPASQVLMQALPLYQGELLPGFYDEWITEEREHLQALFERCMGRLLELLESENRWREVLDWAERWIALAQAPEAAYRSLMIAYDALGDRARVATTYERCVQALRELDLEPSDETRALAFKRSSRLNVPIPLTSFIGRTNELEQITSLLSKSRLVTLTGSGGVGKTRLSIQVVDHVLDRFPDGIWFLDLAPLNDPTLLPNTLANLLKLRDSGDGSSSTTDLLVHYLRPRTSLIILDNCEHLIEPCARLVDELLTSCERLSILATSREALRVSGEIPYRVPSLEVPELNAEMVIDDLADIESLKLFVDRAAVSSPGFALNLQNVTAVAQICQRLDGIPLAIELAAARANVLTVEQISKRLDDRFTLLTGGLRSALPRHQTLQGTIEWSYDLLLEKERLLFRRLAVFVGGWTLEAAEAVCSGEGIPPSEILDLLSQLVNKSLVIVETLEAGLRYRRLETIHQFARKKLAETSEVGQLHERHLEYFVRRAEEVEPYLTEAEQSIWMDILDVELDNIRLALEWSITHHRWDDAHRLFGAIGWFWFIRCHYREGEEWFRRSRPWMEKASKRTQARSLRSASWVYYALDDLSTTVLLQRHSIALYRELGDEKEISTTLQFLGVVEYVRGNPVEARPLLEESLDMSRRINNRPAMPRVLMHLGHYLRQEGDLENARKYFEESLAVCREIGEGHLLMMVLENMGNFMLDQRNKPQARGYYREALEIGIRLKNKRTIAEVILKFAQVLNVEERYLESAQLQGFAERLFEESEALTESYQAAIRRVADLPIKHLGEVSYRREFETGRALRLEQAVQIALELQS